jgi:hypothetical protein
MRDNKYNSEKIKGVGEYGKALHGHLRVLAWDIAMEYHKSNKHQESSTP